MNEVEVMCNGVKYKVTIGKITYGQRNTLIDKFVETVIEDGKTVARMKYGEFEKELVIMAIKKVEPQVNDVRRFVEELDVDEAQKLVKVALELNPLWT